MVQKVCAKYHYALSLSRFGLQQVTLSIEQKVLGLMAEDE